MSRLAWVDGALVPRDEAQVSVDDFGFRYGLTCFETMLAKHGRVFRLEEHLDRLEVGLRLFRAEPPPRARLGEAITATLEANQLVDAAVRLSVTPGIGGPPALPASGAAMAAMAVVTVEPLGPRAPRERLWVSSVRLDASRPWRGAKVAQFAPYLLARAEAEELGFEDALLLNHAGHLVETATSNLFLLVDDALVTSRLEDGPLPGVTRACVMQLAGDLGLPVREAALTLGDLERAVGAFVTSSIAGPDPVVSVTWDDEDGRREWQPETDERGGGALINAIRGAYNALVDAETE